MIDIILVITVNYTRESSIVSILICPRLFIQIGLEFTFDREDFLVEMHIFLSLLLFGTCGGGEKQDTNEIIDHLGQISGMCLILAL